MSDVKESEAADAALRAARQLYQEWKLEEAMLCAVSAYCAAVDKTKDDVIDFFAELITDSQQRRDWDTGMSAAYFFGPQDLIRGLEKVIADEGMELELWEEMNSREMTFLERKSEFATRNETTSCR